METINSSTVDSATLPSLKKHFIWSTILLIMVILFGQSYQDFHRKQEHLDAQRIHSYHQQIELSSDVMRHLLLMQHDNAVSMDVAARHLLSATKELMSVQRTLNIAEQERYLSDEAASLANEEQLLAGYADEFLLSMNEILALAEADALTPSVVLSLYKKMLPNYLLYKDKSARFVEKLTNYLQTESYEHRTVLWFIVGFIMLLVIVAGIVFYRLVSALVNRQFHLLEQDNQLRKKNELASVKHAKLMREQRMKMRSILDSTVDSIITITADGTIDSFNNAAVKMFGYELDEVIGQNIKMLMPEKYAKKHDGYLQHYRETGVRKVIGSIQEVTGQRKDKSQFPMRLSVSEVPQSQPRLFTGIVQDITERKKSDAKLQATMAELREKQAQLEQEERIAQHVFENITASNNDSLPEIASWSKPMGTFSGDMMLSTRMPSGTIRVLLCDFTGHGLPAALGAIPVSVTHRAMAQKDLPLDMVMDELNNKLNALLPTGIFCCIVGIDIDATHSHAHIWNGGLPEVLLVSQSGEIKQRIKSDHLPLGVVKYDRSELHSVDVHLDSGDSFYLYSDGLTEAENPQGEMFGQQRFEALLARDTDENGRMIEIQNSVTDFVKNAPANDDISLIEIKTLVMSDEIILES